MNTLKKIGKLLRNNLDIIFVFFGMLCIALLLRKSVGFKVLSLRPLAYNIFFAGFVSSLMFMMGKKTRFIYSLLILLVCGLLALIQALHFDYFTTFFSISKISILKEALTVKGEAADKFQPYMLLFMLPFVLNIIVFFLRGEKIKYPPFIRYGLTIVVATFCLISMTITVVTYPTNEDDPISSDQYLYSTLFNKVKAVNQLGFYSYTLKDFQLSFLSSKKNAEPLTNIKEYLSMYGYTHEDNQYTGMFEGKNLVLVLCESLSNPALVNKNVTPTLYMMKNEGISFNNHYAPIYQSATADSEFISLTSMMPSVTGGPTAYNYYENQFNVSLPNELEAKGYTSNSFHSFHDDFYNRNVFHTNLGFEQFYADNELSFEKREDWQDAYNWVLDKYLFQQTVEVTNTLNSKPFFDFVITTSGHIPYNKYRYEMEGNIWFTELEVGFENDPYSIEAICYFAGQQALDDGLAELISGLEESGDLDNTVIAIYGDHYPYGMSEAGLKELFYYPNDELYKRNNVPFIIWTPNMDESIQIDKVTSTFDIFPTLANLFNIDLTGRYIVGTDALSDEECMVIWDDYSWLTDHAYYNSTSQKLTKFDDISDIEITKINEKVVREISIGQDYLNSDYYYGN